MYAVLATTDYYGPSTQVQVIAFASKKSVAQADADQRNARPGQIYLGHNQASGTRYEVRRVDESRCRRGYNCAPMYRGEYLPEAATLAARGLIVVAFGE